MTAAATSNPGSEAPRIRAWMLQVIRTTQVTPHLQRVTLGGEGLTEFPTGREGAHLRVLIPLPGQEKPVLPEVTAEGLKWPPKDVRPIVRVYTLRRHNAEAGEIEIDFVLHGDNGPASAWASHAKPGDYLGVGAVATPDPDVFTADWVLFTGDQSSLPAISAYLETLPPTTRGYAFVEVADASEEQIIQSASQVELVWLHQNGITSGKSTLLLDAVRAVAWPESGSVYTWLAGESSTVVAIRQWLREEHQISREQLYAVPYWKAGSDEETYHAERHRIMDDEK